jgi:hypothetical protein
VAPNETACASYQDGFWSVIHPYQKLEELVSPVLNIKRKPGTMLARQNWEQLLFLLL